MLMSSDKNVSFGIIARVPESSLELDFFVAFELDSGHISCPVKDIDVFQVAEQVCVILLIKSTMKYAEEFKENYLST